MYEYVYYKACVDNIYRGHKVDVSITFKGR